MRQASILSVLVAAALLAGCGGGGSSMPAASPANGASNSASSGKAIATANLTVRFPASFHQAKTTSSSTRSPKYVNPNAYYLDVFVDGTHVIAPGGPNVVNSPDGSQTFTLPIYSTSGHQVVAVESSGVLNTNQILALGEFDIQANSFSPGDSFAVGLTMAMNVEQVGFMTDQNGTNAGINTNYSIGCGGPAPFTVGPFYPFAADATGGFVTNAGLGSVTPVLTSWLSQANSPPNSLAATTTGQNQGFNVTINNNSDIGVQVQLSTLNPANNIAQDVYAYQGDYPGIQNLYYSNQLYLYTINSVNNYVKNLLPSC